MNDAGPTGRNSTSKSAAVILLLVVIVIALIMYLALNPELLENLAYLVIAAVIVIAVAAVIIYLVVMILAVPYYAMKGETYQTGADYDLDDVKSVKETDSEKKE